MAQPRLRVALDTNVLIAGIVWPRCRTKCSVQRWPGTSTSCCRSKWSKRSDRDFTDPGALAERFSRDVKIDHAPRRVPAGRARLESRSLRRGPEPDLARLRLVG